MAGALLATFYTVSCGPVLTMVLYFAGDEQLLVKGEGERVQATQGQD
jgi:hypothetical protein